MRCETFKVFMLTWQIAYKTYQIPADLEKVTSATS